MSDDTASNNILGRIRRAPVLAVTLAVSLLAVVYWSLVASDRYVSEAHVVVKTANTGGGGDIGVAKLLGGLSGLGGSSAPDQMLLRDHLLSVDMLKKLDADLNLRAHYGDRSLDLLSRMWSADEPLEWFYAYYLSRVSVEYDDRDGVLVIKAQAFDAKTAQAIAETLVHEGEKFMNAMAHRLAEGQVQFLEGQVASMAERADAARKAMLNFQNRNGLISPEGAAESLASIVGGLQAQLADLEARRSAMAGYLMDDSAELKRLDLQIAGVKRQIERERLRLTSSNGSALNEMVEQYQRLQLAAELAQDAYKSALVALEQGRIEATRLLKKVSIVQAPTLPEYPLEPRRIYNTVVFVLVTMLVAGIFQLLGAIVRDHKD